MGGYLAKSTFRLRCHCPSDNPTVLTGAGSEVILLAATEECGIFDSGVDRGGLSLPIVSPVKQKHFDLFRQVLLSE